MALRAVRLEKGLTIVEAASRAGMTKLKLGHIERGRESSVAYTDLLHLCDALGVEELALRERAVQFQQAGVEDILNRLKAVKQEIRRLQLGF